MSNSVVNPFWCVSANPAIDKRVRVSALTPGRVNRIREVHAEPGGKAAHVAMVLRALGAYPLWLGFAGGSTGEQLLTGLQALAIGTLPIRVNADTRVNLEIIDNQGDVTELLEPGAQVAEHDWQSFFEACENLLSDEKRSGTVIASGSLPPDADPAFYGKLTELAHRLGHKMFLDTGGESLRIALNAGPDFVKPNREEAEDLLGATIGDCKSAAEAVHRFIQLGARSAVVSLGQEGFVWLAASGGSTYWARPASVKVTSSVGCGDATVAAFAYAMSAGFSVEHTLRLAAACGAANCLAECPGRVRDTDVRALEAKVSIKKLE